MTDRILFALPGNEALTASLASKLGCETGTLEVRRFPDGESYIRYQSDVATKTVVLICSLDRPDDKFLRLMFSAQTAREQGAPTVGLVCPYLAYMRQDKQFRPGEAVTSTQFAQTISATFDWLITVDPHLHRRHGLEEIYRIPALSLHATGLVASWVQQNIQTPLFIGPDSESEQWVAAVAKRASAPHIILTKTRRGDREVTVSVPNVSEWMDRTPVLVDDIISTGRTMIETVQQLCSTPMRAPICIGTHGIFAEGAYEDLIDAGAAQVITTNSIEHASNQIDLSDLIADGLASAIP